MNSPLIYFVENVVSISSLVDLITVLVAPENRMDFIYRLWEAAAAGQGSEGALFLEIFPSLWL